MKKRKILMRNKRLSMIVLCMKMQAMRTRMSILTEKAKTTTVLSTTTNEAGIN